MFRSIEFILYNIEENPLFFFTMVQLTYRTITTAAFYTDHLIRLCVQYIYVH